VHLIAVKKMQSQISARAFQSTRTDGVYIWRSHLSIAKLSLLSNACLLQELSEPHLLLILRSFYSWKYVVLRTIQRGDYIDRRTIMFAVLVWVPALVANANLSVRHRQ
jgi:hypothetical protein